MFLEQAILYKRKRRILCTKKLICNISMLIAELKPGSMKGIIVSYEMFLTMLDGKIIHSLTGYGTQTCYICGATPEQRNDLEMVKQQKETKEIFCTD